MIAAMQSLDRMHRAPSQALPDHAADCHMHVFGPFERFPLAGGRAYNVPEAPLEAHERMKLQVGLERTVLVQASGYGDDNRAMLAALARLGARGRAVAVRDPRTPARELEMMHAAGVRGLRLNLVTLASRYSGDRAQLVVGYERVLAPFGWHLQVFADAAAPERLVWGSDWPHIGFHSRQQVHGDTVLPYRELDAGELLDILVEAIPDRATRRAILADNPARLYGFDR